MKNLLLITIFIFYGLLIQYESKAQINTELIIGADEVGKKEYLFEYPGFVSTDKELNIYIAEKKALVIRVYDKKGRFIREFGKRGRGPGEFLDITLMKINHNDELMVFDNFMYRITFFSLGGKYLRAINYNPQYINWPRNITQLNDGGYIMSYYLENENNLFHLWNNDLTKRLDVINEYQLDEEDNIDLQKVKIYGLLGNFIDEKNGILAVTKYLYDGKVYLFKYFNKRISFYKIINGFTYKNESYTKIIDKSREKNYDIEAFYLNNTFKAMIHNKSLGVFFMNNGHLLNFTILEKDKYMILGYEEFNEEYNFLGYKTIYKNKITDENRKYLLYGYTLSHKDKNDNFYLIDETEYPKVKRIVIK